MKYSYLFIFLILNISAYSQNNIEKSISTEDGCNIGWFGNPSLNFTLVDQHFEVMGNIDAGVSINNKLLLGMFFSSALTGIEPEGHSYDDGYKNYLEMGGAYIGYVFNSDKNIHPTLFIRSGFGNFAVENIETDVFTNFSLNVISPGVSVDYRISRLMQFSFQVSYRIISPVDLYIDKYAFLSGTELGLSVKFGSFK